MDTTLAAQGPDDREVRLGHATAEDQAIYNAIAENYRSGNAVFGIIDPEYGRVFTIARLIAWQEGYSVCAQGSFTRDLDLLAVPWTELARKDTEILVRRIAQAAGLTIQGEPSDKPHGRKAWTLLFPAFGDPRFVDLSVMPPNVHSA